MRLKKAINPTDPDIRLKTLETLNSRLERLIGPVSRVIEEQKTEAGS